MPIAWFARAREQRQTVQELQSLGAACFFDYQMNAVNAPPTPRPNALPRFQRWSAPFLGNDLWGRVVLVEFYPREVDEKAKNRLLAMGRDRQYERMGLMEVREREKQPIPERRMGLFPPLIEPKTAEPAIHSETLRFGDDQMHLLARLTDLETLNLSYTYITDAGLSQLVGLRKLTELRLQGTDVGDSGMEHVGKLTQLRVLHLNYTQVTDAGLVHLRHLKNLEQLLIWGTQIGDAGVAHLTSLKQLRVLILFETQVTDEGIALLESMSSLEHVNFRSTRVSREGHRSIKEALPNCLIQPEFW